MDRVAFIALRAVMFLMAAVVALIACALGSAGLSVGDPTLTAATLLVSRIFGALAVVIFCLACIAPDPSR